MYVQYETLFADQMGYSCAPEVLGMIGILVSPSRGQISGNNTILNSDNNGIPPLQPGLNEILNAATTAAPSILHGRSKHSERQLV